MNAPPSNLTLAHFRWLSAAFAATDSGMGQSDLPEERRQRLRQPRIDFAVYYGAATPADAEVMDQLVLAHAAYLAIVQFRPPRQESSHDVIGLLPKNNEPLF